MNAKAFDHVAVKVEQLDDAIVAFQRLGFTLRGRARHPDAGMEVAFLELGGVRFELLQSIASHSPIAKAPHGLHHFAVACDDFHGARQSFEADPRCVLLGPTRPGAHGNPVFFLHLPGVRCLIEIVGPTERHWP